MVKHYLSISINETCLTESDMSVRIERGSAVVMEDLKFVLGNMLGLALQIKGLRSSSYF